MLALIAAFVLQTAPAPAAALWTWTLYENEGPIVLAREVPDTTDLSATFECQPGTGVARMTLYGGEASTGMARVSSGEAAAMAEAESVREGGVRIALRTDHPAFIAFAASGDLNVMAGNQRRVINIPEAHLVKLRRFAELCSG